MSSADPNRIAVFRPEVFEVGTLEEAKRVTVTPEVGTTTEERWFKETSYLIEDISRFLPIGREHCVLDFGCGTGRIAKELIARHGCRVMGVDASKAMRLLSPTYVLSERFNVWPPEVLDTMVAQGFRVDFAICLWVIQHVYDPAAVIQQIVRSLAPGGLLYTLNGDLRCVPTDMGWVNDGFEVQAALRQALVEEESHLLPVTVTTPILAQHSVVQVLRKRPAT